MQLTRRAHIARPLLLVVGVVLAVFLGLGLGASAASATPATPSPDPTSPTSGPIFNGTITNAGTPLEGVEITVEGNGFDETVATDATGRWQIIVPAAGTYTVTIDTATLPDGVTIRDETFVSREFTIAATATQGVLFPFGPAGTTTPSSTGDTGNTGTNGESSETGGTSTEPSTSTSTSTSSNDFGTKLFARIISGLSFGLLLALGAIGITLIFGTTGVNNFAHGEMLTFGGIVFYFTTTLVSWPVWVAVIATLIASAAFGWLNDAAIFRPLRKKRVGLVQVLIVTIGLSIALRYFFQFLIGGGTHQLHVDTGGVVRIGPINLTTANLVGTGISIVVLVLVGLFLTRTRIGKATRAVSDNSSLAAASGINVDRVIRIVWVLAGLLTGLAGILYTYFIGANIKWDVGFTILLLLFAAVTLGGLGSAFGALVGAIIIGLATEISTLWIPADMRYAVALVILILVLLVRPQGILGRRERIG